MYDDKNQQYAKDAITVRIQSAQTEDERMTTEFSSPFEIGEEVFLFVAAKEPDSIYDEDVFLFITSREHGSTHNDGRYVTGLKYDKSTPDGDKYVNGGLFEKMFQKNRQKSEHESQDSGVREKYNTVCFLLYDEDLSCLCRFLDLYRVYFSLLLILIIGNCDLVLFGCR